MESVTIYPGTGQVVSTYGLNCNIRFIVLVQIVIIYRKLYNGAISLYISM